MSQLNHGVKRHGSFFPVVFTLFMQDERRINVRVPAADFERLGDKRHRLRTTWQSLLGDFLTEWLADESTPSLPAGRALPEEQAFVDAVLEVLRSPDDPCYVTARLLLDGFLREVRIQDAPGRTKNLSVPINARAGK